MGRFIRMIDSISKWDGSRIILRKDGYICGDAISDLRTQYNNLSVWKADTQEDIEDAIVALALNRDNVQKINYLILDEEELGAIEIKASDEHIGVAGGLEESILKKHRDLVDIDYWRIGFLAEYMMKLAKKEGNRHSLTAKGVEILLEKYKNWNRIDPEQVKEKLRRSLNW